MIYRTPEVEGRLADRLQELDRLRSKLGYETRKPSPWLGSLRRQVKAASVESSVSIEGYGVPEREAEAIIRRSEAAEETDESRSAVACYARALDHVGVLALDPAFRWVDRVILDLHFDACSFQRDKSPGHWRAGPIGVTGAGGRIVYEAPPAEDVILRMDEILEWLRTDERETHVVVRAAMAHLHVVSVHPFRDGNGRISRIVQSLVLALDGLLSPEFASIEEYLAAHTAEYYAVLQSVQGGRYQPERDATEWVDLCVEAHLFQASARLEQVATAAARWSYVESLVEDRGWPDRLVIALEQSLIRGTDRALYGGEAEISFATASNDFRRLVDAGLVTRTGKGRNIRYEATSSLRERVDAAVQARAGEPNAPRRHVEA